MMAPPEKEGRFTSKYRQDRAEKHEHVRRRCEMPTPAKLCWRSPIGMPAGTPSRQAGG